VSISEGLQWICREIGHVREEEVTLYYMDNILQAEVKRMLVLEEVKYKGESLSSLKYNALCSTGCLMV
jgi:predicted RNA methylase